MVAALLLGGCAAQGGGDAITSATAPTSPTTAAPRSDAGETDQGTYTIDPAKVDWVDCDGGFECATIAVPVDYDDPTGATLDLAITRHPANDPSQRIGALLVNPGGPGASSIDFAHQLPRTGWLGDQFDMVGFDPRGVGLSSPLDCHSHLQSMYAADPTIDSEADRDLILEESQAFVDECERKHGDVLAHLGTSNVARDMDLIRQALGEEQINYLGYSYGTSIGQEYARLFPTKVRAMVLDGVVDQAPDGVAMATTQAEGFEQALDAYIAHCDDGDGCGFGAPAREVVDEVIAAAEAEPLPAPDADRPATPGVVNMGIGYALYSEVLWSTLSAALRDARDGDGSGLVSLADQYLDRGSDGEYTGGMEVYLAVSCLDDPWPADPDDLLDAASAAGEGRPYFGEAIVGDYVRCSLWPVPPQPLAPVPADTEGLPPIMVVSTTGDPATPYENGVAVAKQIPGAFLVTNEGEGHGIVAQGKPCIDDVFEAYLVDLEVPDAEVTCPA